MVYGNGEKLDRDFYEILGVPRTAGRGDIKRAYRKQAKRWHPDVCKEPGAEDKFKEINAAYDVLKDPEKRKLFDLYGEQGVYYKGPPPPPGGYSRGRGGGQGVDINLEDIFDQFFGGSTRRGAAGGRTGGATAARRGDDLRADLELAFETACFGGKERVKIQHLEGCDRCSGSGVEPGARVSQCGTCGGSGVVLQVTRTPLGNFQTQTTCPTCGGSGQRVDKYCTACDGNGVIRKTKTVSVNVPCGVDDGTKLRLAGEGDAGTQGGPPGDLYIFLTIKPDPYFVRKGQDLYSNIDIDAVDAILGTTASTRTLDEPDLDLTVPPGTQPGTQLKLQKKGVPALNKRNDRGDHFVTVNVRIPTALSPQQRALVEQLKESQSAGDRPRPRVR